jgi:hypothetical protein
MKARYFLLMFFIAASGFNVLSVNAQQQIPNGSFETWNAEGNPDGWITTNFPGVATPITKSSTAMDGSSSLRGEVGTIFGQPIPAMAGTGRMLTAETFELGFPFTSRPQAFNGFVTTDLMPNDTLNLIAVFRSGGDSIGVAYHRVGVDQGFIGFSAPVHWLDNRTPDTAYVMIIVDGEPTPTPGSIFIVDGLSFGAAASVSASSEDGGLIVKNILGGFELEIAQVGSGPSTLEIIDLHGRTVETLLNGSTTPARVRWYGAGHSNGLYIARLTNSDGTSYHKLMLSR